MEAYSTDSRLIRPLPVESKRTLCEIDSSRGSSLFNGRDYRLRPSFVQRTTNKAADQSVVVMQML